MVGPKIFQHLFSIYEVESVDVCACVCIYKILCVCVCVCAYVSVFVRPYVIMCVLMRMSFCADVCGYLVKIVTADKTKNE